MSSDGSEQEQESGGLPFVLKERPSMSLGKMAELRAQGRLKPAAAQVKRVSEGNARSAKKHKKSKSDAPAILSTKVPLSRKRVGEKARPEVGVSSPLRGSASRDGAQAARPTL